VLLDKLALNQENRNLLQENQQLRSVLKQYLDGTLFVTLFFVTFSSFFIKIRNLGIWVILQNESRIHNGFCVMLFLFTIDSITRTRTRELEIVRIIERFE